MSILIQSYSGPHFPAFGLNTQRCIYLMFSVRMRQNADQNNSEYGHFSRSVHYTHFMPVFHFCVLLKCQKTKVFLKFVTRIRKGTLTLNNF